MNLNQWLSQVSHAYQFIGKQFSLDKVKILLKDSSNTSPNKQAELFKTTYEAMIKYFFKKASQGETFGDLNRFKEIFGVTIENFYGLSTGPFINMAKTYWTFRIELRDIPTKYKNTNIYLILSKLEIDISGAFFPTPGPFVLKANLLKETQRSLLQKYAPSSIDIEKFLAESPILKTLKTLNSNNDKHFKPSSKIKYFHTIIFKPKWYKMLPDWAKCLNNDKIIALESIRKNMKISHMNFSTILVMTPWGVKKLQYDILKKLTKIEPTPLSFEEKLLNVIFKHTYPHPERVLWGSVLYSRLQTMLRLSPLALPYPNEGICPLNKDEILSRLKSINVIIEQCHSFEDVVKFILCMDEEQGYFNDPLGIIKQLSDILGVKRPTKEEYKWYLSIINKIPHK